jgi:hypothetical protein
MTSKTSSKLMCPSADVDMAESAIFGIVIGTPEAPNLVYLDRVKPIPPELLALDSPVKPSEIFRIAATCVERGCKHFDGAECRLVERIVARLPAVVETIPDCAIRDRCRWWNQEGKAACLRCSQIVHDNYVSSDNLILEVADPQT